ESPAPPGPTLCREREIFSHTGQSALRTASPTSSATSSTASPMSSAASSAGLFFSQLVKANRAVQAVVMSMAFDFMVFLVRVGLGVTSVWLSAQSAAQRGDDQQHEEDEEEDLGDARSGSGEAGEAEQAGDESKGEKCECPMKHVFLSVVGFL